MVPDTFFQPPPFLLSASSLILDASFPTLNPSRLPMTTTALPAWHDSLLMRAARRQSVPRTPIWLMRQAGDMSEYRALRKTLGFLELCNAPTSAPRSCSTTVERLGGGCRHHLLRPAGLLEPLGLNVEFTSGEGPLLDPPLRSATDVGSPAGT